MTDIPVQPNAAIGPQTGHAATRPAMGNVRWVGIAGVEDPTTGKVVYPASPDAPQPTEEEQEPTMVDPDFKIETAEDHPETTVAWGPEGPSAHDGVDVGTDTQPDGEYGEGTEDAVEVQNAPDPRSDAPDAGTTPVDNDIVQVYEDSSGKWRWRRVAGNHEKIADGAQGYASKAGVKRAALRSNPDLTQDDLVELEEVEDAPEPEDPEDLTEDQDDLEDHEDQRDLEE